MATLEIADAPGGVRVLTLARRPANVLDSDLLDRLDAALTEAERLETVRAVVVRGSGGFFSAGFDLGTDTPGGVHVLIERGASTILRLFALPKPTLALVNGHAVAGGLLLALACDYRLGVDGDHKVGLNEVAIGGALPTVGLEIVRLRLPHGRASEMLLGSALYPAGQAVRLGLVDETLPAGSADDTVLRRAGRLAAFPREAYAHAKGSLIGDAVARTRAETAAERASIAAVWAAPESRAAQDRQREKLRKS